MPKVLIVATSRKTRGGITSVIKLHETGEHWKKYHCFWIQTHRDGAAVLKLLYLISALLKFLFLLPSSDIVHIHSAGRTSAKRKLLFAHLAHKCGKRVIIHFHPSGPEEIFADESHSIVRRLFDSADIVVVLSPQWRKWINEAYPDNSYNIVIIWNPCPQVNRLNCLRKKQILFAGTIIKRKGYDVLLMAFSKIAKKHPDWKVVFAGNSDKECGIEDGKRIASELGITNQVVWLGWVSGENKDRIFQECSIYCLASKSEGFPMGVLDAWAYGLPVISTTVGGIPDVAIDGVNVLLVNPGDVITLANQIDRLISDDNLRHKIIEASHELAITKFNINNISKQIEELYEELLN